MYMKYCKGEGFANRYEFVMGYGTQVPAHDRGKESANGKNKPQRKNGF